MENDKARRAAAENVRRAAEVKAQRELAETARHERAREAIALKVEAWRLTKRRRRKGRDA